jgi:hypothetical protein
MPIIGFERARCDYLAKTRTILLSQGHCQTQTGGEKEDFAEYEQPGRPALTPYRLQSLSFHDFFPLGHVGMRLKFPET